jgi:Lysyl oxidase
VAEPGTYKAMRIRRFAVIAVFVCTGACSGSAAGTLPKLLLPDLDQRPPLAVSVRWGGPPKHHPLLVFTSSVENVGYGPLIVEGRRASRRVSSMRADQLVPRRQGGYQLVRGVGRLRYNINPSHSHWHLLPFERYELRTLSGKQIVRDHKSGFCLTSDHSSPLTTLGARAAQPNKGTDCARDKPRALSLREGIAVGWGDIYIPAKEGQAIDINGVAPGDYDLVHRVNVTRLLREARYSNDDSSLRIRLLAPPTPNDLPGVVVLKTCETGIRC